MIAQIPTPPATSRLVFLHLPRTGGTSLHEALAPLFLPTERCPERFANLERLSSEEMARYRFFSGHYRFDELRLIPHQRFLCTVLRDPQARILSLYHFWRRHRDEVVEKHQLIGAKLARSLDLLDFLRCRDPVVRNVIDNAVACTLAGRVQPVNNGEFAMWDKGGVTTPIHPADIVTRACDAILAFDAVGFTETLPALHAHLTRAMGLPTAPLLHLNGRDRRDWALEDIAEQRITPEIALHLQHLTRMDRQVLAFAENDPRVQRV